MQPLPQRQQLARSSFVIASVLAFALSLTAAHSALAQTSGEVDVTATVGTSLAPLTLTICDGAADFGTNLDADGTVSNSLDTILAIPGNPATNQGAYYKWTPACGTGSSFLSINATTTWTGAVCATENSGTSSLSLADNDLRFSQSNFFAGSYNSINSVSTIVFPDCDTSSHDWTNLGGTGGGAGITNRNFFYYLQVDRSETVGTFESTTTWSITG